MTIKEQAERLQQSIDEKMDIFSSMGKKAKELKQKIDTLHVQMGIILKELVPVDAIIRAQHPEKCALFDLLIEAAEDSE